MKHVTDRVQKRIAISFFYMFLGFITGTWVSRIPDVKSDNDISNGMLGVSLVLGAVGAMSALPCINVICTCIGSGRTCLLGCIWCCAIMPSLGVGLGVELLMPAIFLLGAGMAAIDVTVNVQAVGCEKHFAVSAMGQFFAISNIGAMLGALLGGSLAQYNITVFIHFVIVGICCIPFCVFFSIFLFPKAEEADIYEDKDQQQPLLDSSLPEVMAAPKQASSGRFDWAIVYLCVVGLLATTGEGGLTDWTTLYFQENLDQSPVIASVGFSVFSGCIAVGRVSCDYLTMRYSRAILVRISGFSSGIGLLLTVLAASLSQQFVVPTAIFGLGITGLSLSVIAPIVTSSAGSIPGVSPQDGISTVSGVAYLAYLIGPPLFGGVSFLLGSLRWAFLVMAGILMLIVIIPGKPPDHIIYDIAHNKMNSEILSVIPRMNTAGTSSNSSEVTLHQAIFDTDAIVVRDSMLEP